MKVHNLLGLAMRARKVDVGSEKVEAGIRANKYQLVIIANDASDLTQERFMRLMQKNKTNYVFYSDKIRLAEAIGKFETVAIGVTDRGFATKILTLINDEK